MRSFESLDVAPEYEWLKGAISGLERVSETAPRIVRWLESTHVLGAARSRRGAVEIFVAGQAIESSDPLVKEAMRFGEWKSIDGEHVVANQLLLPPEPYFDQVAAFICAELLAAGIGSDRDSAFHATEPIIALAMKRAMVSDEGVLGLAGELTFFNALVWSVPEHSVENLIPMWKGAGQSSRDFQLGAIGVEVKTTTRPSSIHHIKGLHQVEVGSSVDGEPEHTLHMLSLGVRWLDADDAAGYSIAGLVDSIIGRIASPALEDEFLQMLRHYNSPTGHGYDHHEQAGLAKFRRRFALTWARLYDLTDPAIRLITSETVGDLVHVVPASIAFSVSLPETISGDINPVVGLPEVVEKLLNDAGFGG